MPKITNETNRLRLKAFRSNKWIYAQVIDDKKRIIVVSENDFRLNIGQKMTKRQRAKEVGLKLAEKLLKLKITRLIFDRGYYRYAGRVKALIEGVREGGIKI